MNTKTLFPRLCISLAAVTILSMAAAGTSFADDHHHDAWSHDRNGYWDNHGAHHAFVMHGNHHGFWRTRDDGTRIFVNID